MYEPTDAAHGLTKKLLLGGLAISVAICLIYLIHPSFITSTNNRATDVIMSLAPSKQPSGSVLIVDIDESSLAEHGQWPWPRDLLARLLGTIEKSGATSIGLDLILAEADRTSPGNNMNEPVRGTSTIRTSPPDHDQLLASALTKGPFVLGFEFLFKKNDNSETACKLHPPGIIQINNSSVNPNSTAFFKARGVVCNRQLFSDAVAYSGFLNATPDADGVLRRIPMLIQFGDKLYPSLSLAMLMQHDKSRQISILARENGSFDLVAGENSISVDSQGRLIVPFSRRASATPRVSARDILKGNVSANQIKGKLVLIGSSAAGLDNLYQTPVSQLYSHVDVHAQILDKLLSGHQIIRTRQFLVWEALISLVAAAGACLAIARFGILASAAVSMSCVTGIWICMGLLFHAKGYLLSPLLPTVLVLLNYVILTIFKSRKIQVAAWKRANSSLALLKSSEKELNSIIKTVPDIIFRLDPEGRIIFISPAIAKYADSPDELLGKSIFDLVDPTDIPKALFRLNEKRTGNRATRDLEIRMLLPKTQNGSIKEKGYFRISAEGIYQSETPSQGTFVCTQGIIHDITEQKKLEEKLLHAQKMEAIGNLAAGVAHDLNNILTGLVAYPDLLLREVPPDSPMYNKITLIQKSGQKAAAVVQDLLTMARCGVKVSEIVNLNFIVMEYLASLEFDDLRKNHQNTTVESSLTPDLLNTKGSKVHLAKVIMNMITNAAEAMPAGGVIKLSSYNRCLDTTLNLYEEIPPGEYVCITVADQGIGISDEDLNKIFEPFYSKKSMKRSGSGLGMTIIWSTIKDHNGYIDIRSKEGEGASLTLYLPVTRDSVELSSLRIVLEDYIGTERVLIVDDMAEQLQVADNMLSRLGYVVKTVTCGEAAVEYLRSHAADLVVLDMIMPGGMDGLETYTHILKVRPGQRAIITSGYSESERVKSLQQLGAGEYVQKPYTLEKFGMAVRRELDRVKAG